MSMLAKGLGRVAGYVYRDDAYCPACIVDAVQEGWHVEGLVPVEFVEHWLDLSAKGFGIDRDMPRTLRSWSNHKFPDRLYATAIDAPWLCETCRKEIR